MASRNRAITAFGLDSWWLQMRITRQPLLRSARVTVRSRRMLRAILARQYARLVLGGLKHRGQACQKQPSTNTTICAKRKVKSGFPISAWWRRQPDIPALRRSAIRRISVSLFPRERILDISWERANVVLRLDIFAIRMWESIVYTTNLSARYQILATVPTKTATSNPSI